MGVFATRIGVLDCEWIINNVSTILTNINVSATLELSM